MSRNDSFETLDDADEEEEEEVEKPTTAKAGITVFGITCVFFK